MLVPARAPDGPPDTRRRLVVDALIALALAWVQLVSVAVVAADQDVPAPPVAYAVLALATLPLVLRRVRPVEVWGVVTIATAAYGLADWPDPPLYLGGLLALYTVAASTPDRVARAVGASTLALVPIAWLVDPAPTDANDVLTPVLAIATAWLAGRAMWSQGQVVALLAERADRAEGDRATAADRAVADERFRIARELHDITAHHVSVIAVQAEAGAAAPATALDALEAIGASARRALMDLRRMLGVLRSGPAADRHPQAALADLDALAEPVRAAGLEVEVVVDPHLEEEAGLELAAYRIVQEALTNVVRHAGATRVLVRITGQPDGLAIEVVDDGTADPSVPTTAGNGLSGMRERVELYDGELTAAAVEPVGFAIRARLRR